MNYSNIAERFNDIARARFAAYLSAKTLLDEAEQNLIPNAPRTDLRLQAAKARAEARYNELKLEFESAKKELYSESALMSLRKELETMLNEDYRARPDDVDRDVLVLLDADVLNVGEYENLLKSARPTMKRIILKYIDKKAHEAEKDKDTETARALNTLKYEAQQDTPRGRLATFDEVVEIYRRTAANPAMMSKWHELTEPLLEVF